MRMRLLDDWLAIQPIPTEDWTRRATVLDVGPDVHDIEVGDVVAYVPDAGHTGEVNHKRCLLIGRLEIIGVIESRATAGEGGGRARARESDDPRDPVTA